MVAESTRLKDLRGRYGKLAGDLKAIFDEAGPDYDFGRVKSLQGDTHAKLEEVQRRNRELDEAHDAVEAQRTIEGIAQKSRQAWEDDNLPTNVIRHPSDGSDGRRPSNQKSLGALLVESPEFRSQKSLRRWSTPAKLDYDIRATVFRTGAGWDPEVIRIDRVELSAQRPIAVVDNIPMLPTSMDTIRYMKETTFTNNAVETAESTATTASDLIGEAALALTETSDEVEWLPVFLPVTIQQMEDVEGIEAYINARLTYMLRQRLDSQCVVGDGSTPNLLGTNNLASILSQAKGTDPTPDAIYKAFTQIRVTGMAEPSVLFAHPNDWQDVRLLRTADGIYIFGSPMDAGADRIWGVPVVKTAAVTENTMTTGDYANFSALYTKRGVNIEVSDSHAFYFTRGMLAVRADIRVSMVHFRDTAFCKVTGV